MGVGQDDEGKADMIVVLDDLNLLKSHRLDCDISEQGEKRQSQNKEFGAQK